MAENGRGHAGEDVTDGVFLPERLDGHVSIEPTVTGQEHVRHPAPAIKATIS